MRASPWALSLPLLLLACGEAGDDPLAPPDDLRATPGTGTVALAWRPPADATPTAIVRFGGAEPRALPSGAALDVGRSFGPSAVVLYSGNGDSFVNRSIEGCSAYVYQAFTVGSGGRRSEPASLAFDGAQSVAPATSPPASLDATFAERGIHLTWTAPATPADHVRVVRRLGAPVTGPDDGEIIVTERTQREHVDRVEGHSGASGLEPGATYHYAAYGCDACERCEDVGSHASATTPIALGDAPTDLEVDPDGATVHFRWKAPNLGGFVAMRLFVRVGAPVEGPDDPDADVIHEGADHEARVAMTTFLPDVSGDGPHYHFAVYACAGDSCSDGAIADRTFSLGDALRGGGYIVYFRHAEAGVCIDRTDLGTAEETTTPDWWKSCERSCDVATAEQLSAQGFEDAEAAGLALRNAGIPFNRALSSEYCRAVETAHRLQILLPSETSLREELTPFVYGDDDVRCTSTLELLAGAALGAVNRNAALVGHGALPEACAQLEALAPGEAAVFRPADGGPLLVTRVLPRDWGGAL